MSINKEKILSNLSPKTVSELGEIHCFELLDSTNRWLFNHAESTDAHCCVCIADAQTAGVGRSGKQWLASDSKNILMSIAYQFDLPLAQLSSLSLVVGIAMINALENLGVEGLFLKWPNDIYLNNSKLAGILIQTQKYPETGYWAVVGIGLNLELEDEDREKITQPVAQLSSVGLGKDKRELIIAKILDELVIAFKQFGQQGLPFFQQRWSQLDYLKDQMVTLIQADERITGHYLGVNLDGAVRIALPNNQIKEYYVGEISLRKNAIK